MEDNATMEAIKAKIAEIQKMEAPSSMGFDRRKLITSFALAATADALTGRENATNNFMQMLQASKLQDMGAMQDWAKELELKKHQVSSLVTQLESEGELLRQATERQQAVTEKARTDSIIFDTDTAKQTAPIKEALLKQQLASQIGETEERKIRVRTLKENLPTQKGILEEELLGQKLANKKAEADAQKLKIEAENQAFLTDTLNTLIRKGDYTTAAALSKQVFGTDLSKEDVEAISTGTRPEGILDVVAKVDPFGALMGQKNPSDENTWARLNHAYNTLEKYEAPPVAKIAIQLSELTNQLRVEHPAGENGEKIAVDGQKKLHKYLLEAFGNKEFLDEIEKAGLTQAFRGLIFDIQEDMPDISRPSVRAIRSAEEIKLDSGGWFGHRLSLWGEILQKAGLTSRVVAEEGIKALPHQVGKQDISGH